jgi:hypothetical protein
LIAKLGRVSTRSRFCRLTRSVRRSTKIVDDVVFTRAPIDVEGAIDLLDRLRTLRWLPEFLSLVQREKAADFVARFPALVATAPWREFTFEVNPLKLARPKSLPWTDCCLSTDVVRTAVVGPRSRDGGRNRWRPEL